jgi:hypothetical protein
MRRPARTKKPSAGSVKCCGPVNTMQAGPRRLAGYDRVLYPVVTLLPPG